MFLRSCGPVCKLRIEESKGLLERSKICTTASFAGAGVAALDSPDGPATALLVRREVAGFRGDLNDLPGCLKGVENLFLVTAFVEEGVRPKPTRRCGAGVLISMA